ncbi:hypothetical protein Lepto782_23140 (plasmid) [Leptospira interrogans serovar Canicola]|uniref:Uncharacterized protein n=1 Tax=Leptospira interrogans serovar Canicola TaxID=211880 RepID=A0AAP9WG67_LEPIR|nr:hypothetical protein Lepto782_23140 [Leptospira interrogans serovar Canicola]
MNAGYIFTFLFVKLVLSTKCKGCMDTLMNKCSPMSHKIDYRKLLISSFKNILEALNVSSPKNLHETAFENHLSVLLNYAPILFSKLLGLIDY